MRDYSSYSTIRVAQEASVITLTLNRPERRNAVDGAMHTELGRIFSDVAEEDADLIVLTGAGDAFCSGGDADWLEEAHREPIRFEQIVREAKRIVYGIVDCSIPIIARLPGDAVGLGATIALFCDIIVAADTARIGDPHVRVGLAAGDGGAIIWPQLIGFARAKEYLMTGSLIPARDAARMGLINYAVPLDELDAKIAELSTRFVGGPRLSIRGTKASVNIALRQLIGSMLDASLAYETLSNNSQEHREGLAAFREKRRPDFVRGR